MSKESAREKIRATAGLGSHYRLSEYDLSTLLIAYQTRCEIIAIINYIDHGHTIPGDARVVIDRFIRNVRRGLRQERWCEFDFITRLIQENFRFNEGDNYHVYARFQTLLFSSQEWMVKLFCEYSDECRLFLKHSNYRAKQTQMITKMLDTLATEYVK